MSISLKDLKEIERNVINTSIDVLKESMRIKIEDFEGKWADYANESGIVISGEGLNIFLIPLYYFKIYLRDRFKESSNYYDKILDIYPANQLYNDVQEYVEMVEKEGFLGTPYIERNTLKNNFIDSVCFYMSVYFFFLKVFDVPPNIKKRMDKLVIKAFEFLENSYISETGQGWNFTDVDKPSEPYLYATWMALETLSDYLGDDNFVKRVLPSEAQKYLNNISNRYSSLLKYLTDKYINTENENMNILNGEIRFPNEAPYFHYNLYVLLSLQYLNSPNVKEMSKGIDVIYNGFSNIPRTQKKYLKEPWKVEFESRTKTIYASFSDRAFLPLFVKTVALFLRNHPDKDYEHHWDQLKTILELLYQNRKEGRKVWDRFAMADKGYAIYYTERAIEAIFRVLEVIYIYYETASAEIRDLSLQALSPKLLSFIENYVPSTYNITLKVDKVDVQQMITEIVSKNIESYRKEINGLKQKVEEMERKLGEITKHQSETPAEIGRRIESEIETLMLEEKFDEASSKMIEYIVEYGEKIALNSIIESVCNKLMEKEEYKQIRNIIKKASLFGYSFPDIEKKLNMIGG